MPPPPDPKRPRRPEPEVYQGFEVVDDAPPQPAPRKPAPAPAARPAPKPPAQPAPPRKPVRAAVTRDDEDLPVATVVPGPRDDEDDPDPPPRKKAGVGGKKGKKKGKSQYDRLVAAEDEAEADRERSLREFEWTWPTVILIAGVVMTLVGAMGVGGKLEAVQTVVVVALGLCVSIPLTIAVLMVVGIFMGIEYGRFWPAVLKIAAITFVANGVLLVGDWLKFPTFAVFPVSCLVTLGLFMSQFDLDYSEANVTIGALNLMTLGIKVALFAMFLSGGKRDRDTGPDLGPDDPLPGDVRPAPRPDRGRPPPAFEPADPDDDGNQE